MLYIIAHTKVLDIAFHINDIMYIHNNNIFFI